MNKPVLIIPSYKRPDGIAIQRCASLKMDKFIFIRNDPEEIEAYSKWASSYTIITQNHGTDIGKVRRNIVNYCNRYGIKWAFVIDDDVSKVETLGVKDDGSITSQRIIDGSKTPPRFELMAFKIWYKYAKKYHLSLSSPNHRAYDRFHHGELTLNKSAIIQCVLLHIPDIVSVGNYKSQRKVGNEDYQIQFELMKHGFNCGKIGLIEFDVPSVGAGTGGCNAQEDLNLKTRYEDYINLFMTSVLLNTEDEILMDTKITSTGVPSLKFCWKEWDRYVSTGFISLKEDFNA